MSALKTASVMLVAGFSINAFAADFSFDRPGTGIGTGITPIGQLAWEQGLPSARYDEERIDGVKQKTLALNADMLFRTGLAKDLELQLGWQGPAWNKSKTAGQSVEDDGLGDVSIGLKQAIDLNDDKLSMAVLLQALIATGNDGFSEEDDIYILATAVNYQYSELLKTGINMRYDVQNSDWAITAIPNIQYRLNDQWSGFSELVYRKAESQDNEYGLTSGVIYALNERIQLDASVGVDLDGVDKSYRAGLGMAFLF